MFKFILILLGIMSPNEEPNRMNTQTPTSIQNNLFENVSLIQEDENRDGNGHGNGGNTGGNTGQLPPPF
ncbi:hypothetical protein [Chryseobacterium pennae]|uniref:hypothetical protein n=1 Tax=Chryseobacterium pennae TaxID=2258962 RepID=UPI000F4DD981|nr:hypothetical protein [Chryseobacterium pennae]